MQRALATNKIKATISGANSAATNAVAQQVHQAAEWAFGEPNATQITTMQIATVIQSSGQTTPDHLLLLLRTARGECCCIFASRQQGQKPTHVQFHKLTSPRPNAKCQKNKQAKHYKISLWESWQAVIASHQCKSSSRRMRATLHVRHGRESSRVYFRGQALMGER